MDGTAELYPMNCADKKKLSVAIWLKYWKRKAMFDVYNIYSLTPLLLSSIVVKGLIQDLI